MHCMFISTHLTYKTESEISISVDLYLYHTLQINFDSNILVRK